ncbi:uncharacterized protein LOC108958266 isoform X2 [Eucalyptus grandis]|uniref:uncharacterized protein LOC108958266 isoform X2 n=1 Tax=Eucalyptus grandis TaxID=71139 RepID=UPI00192F0B79|nr:uncharacterized protein LOC108958266 isoform X2 [Eucalyptus grandis]
MDIQDSSIPKPSPGNKEVRIDLSSMDMATDQACQDSCKTTREFHEEGSSQGMATNKASQDGCKTTRDYNEESNPMALQPSEIQGDSNPVEPPPDCNEESNPMAPHQSEIQGNLNPPEFRIDLSSLDMATDQACQDNRKTREVHEEGSFEDRSTLLLEDYEMWKKQRSSKFKSKVSPKAVVNKDYRLWFQAAVKGDWKEIEMILNKNRTAMITGVMKIESDDLTMLDVAIMAAQDQLVEKLVKHFPPKCEDLDPKRVLGYAARGGRVRMVKALVDKFDPEPTIIYKALKSANEHAPDRKEVIWYLARRLKCTPKDKIIRRLMFSGHMDICLYLARKYPGSLNFEDTEGVMFLQFLALMSGYFRSGAGLNFWEKLIYKFIPLYVVDTLFDNSKNTKIAQVLNRIETSLWNFATIPELFLIEMKKKFDDCEILGILLTSDVLLDAASRGVFEILDLCLKYYPELLWNNNFEEKLYKEILEGRHVDLYRLLRGQNPVQCFVDTDNSTRIAQWNALTKWSPRCVSPDVSGAAFLLQRELHWFQTRGMGATVSKWLKFQPHKRTLWEIFVKERKELFEEAQQWMKYTSSSCSLVATLIITVAFAAAFTVPGGNIDSMGIPIFLNKGSFMVFMVADSFALLSSVTATLMFLTILTSRYTIEDFLHSLPRKMVMGLTFLILSLASMLVAFSSALTIILSERFKWIYIPITLLTAFPIVLFAILQLPLYFEMVESTYWPRLGRPLKVYK